MKPKIVKDLPAPILSALQTYLDRIDTDSQFDSDDADDVEQILAAAFIGWACGDDVKLPIVWENVNKLPTVAWINGNVRGDW